MNLQRDKGGCTLLNLILTRYKESHKFRRYPEGSLYVGHAVCDYAGEHRMGEDCRGWLECAGGGGLWED